ncbi:MAG: DUF1854 domain-containing protein [Polyangiaceae bacterium]
MLLDLESSPTSSRRREQPTPPNPNPPPEPAFTLERRVDGKLWLRRGELQIAVEVVRCFPWSEPERFLSLRDTEGNEHGFVSEVAELDAASRQALQSGFGRSGFVLDVVRVHGVEEDFELRCFTVDTMQGRRRFQTTLDAWPRQLENGGIVLEDVYGDLYRISAPHKLDAKSLELMRAFID